MFGKKNRSERAKVLAVADFKKCANLDGTDKAHRLFTSRIAQRSRVNLDKIFVQGARLEEKRQTAIAEAIKSGQEPPERIKHDGFNTLKGASGEVVSWVPDEYANQMFSLGADYQIQKVSISDALRVADSISEKVQDDLQTHLTLTLLGMLREDTEGSND